MSNKTSKPTKMGRIQRVENKTREFGSATEYFALWVEDENGKRERCLLFTEHELAKASHRSSRNPEDITKRSWIRKLID